MRSHHRISLTLALGLAAFGCDTPENDETNDELSSSDESDVETGESETGESESETGTSESDTGETETGETESETETGDDPIPGCECILDEDFNGAVVDPSLPTCGDPLCEQIEIGEGDMVMNPEAVDCALVALRDRTPGYLTWHRMYNILNESSGYILIHADGRGVERWWGPDDKAFDISDAQIGELPAADYYDACLAELEPMMRYYCVREDLVSVDGVCNAGWSDF